MEISRDMWAIVQAHLGYDDEEMAIFQGNPKTTGIVSKIPKLMALQFVFEVVQSKGCGAQHRVGDRVIFDGLGCLVPGQNAKGTCAFAVSSMSQLIWTAQELVYAGVNPNDMRLDRVCCIDVGVKCGGLGNVVFQFRAEKSAAGK